MNFARACASAAFVFATSLAGCSRTPAAHSTEPSAPLRTPPPRAANDVVAPPHVALPDAPPLPPSTYSAPPRLVAIGDVHGDLDSFRNVLRLAGAIDASDHWSGGALWIVQTGDLLDRGDQERGILDLVARLESEAAHAGGRFLALNGNHEIMNTQGDFRYVTPGGYTDFAAFASEASSTVREEFPSEVEGRAAVFAPGGRYARQFAGRNTVAIVGDTVFVHGGLLASHADAGIETINRAVRAFFLGQAQLPELLRSEDSPVWMRTFAMGDDPAMCAQVDAALAHAHVHRMVIGHTVQREGINAACNQHVWRIDVGLARLYDGPIEALEITGNSTRVLHGNR